MEGLKKRPQSDYSALEIDTSGAERWYVLVNQKTDLTGNDITATPEYIDRDNQRRAAIGDPWRWVPYEVREGVA